MWQVVKVASTICTSLGYRLRYSMDISVLILWCVITRENGYIWFTPILHPFSWGCTAYYSIWTHKCYEWRGEFSISLFLTHNHGQLFPLQIITNQNTVFSPTILLNHSTYTLQYYQIIHSIYKIIPSISFTCNIRTQRIPKFDSPFCWTNKEFL